MSFDTTTTMPLSSCCECGHASDRAGGEGTPEPGDFSLCIRCASLNVYGENMVLRAPRDEEIFAAAADSDVQFLRKLILQANDAVAAGEA